MPIYFINTKIFQKVLEFKVNNELVNIHIWLSASKLSPNIDKLNFVIFYSPQRKLPFHVTLSVDGINLNQEYSIKYLGIAIDCNLSLKSQVSCNAKMLRRNIGILSKLRNYVNSDILVKLYYALIYPFLTYGLISWVTSILQLPSLCSFYKREQYEWWLSLNFTSIPVQFSNA